MPGLAKRFVILSLALVLGAHSLAGAQTPPNVVLIYVDDFPWYGTSVQMNPGDPGSYTSYQRTPNIESLASQGLTFSRAFSSAGLCGPSRASMQLGQTTARSRYTGNTGNPDTGVETPGIDDNNSTHILNEPNSYIHLPSEKLTMGEAMQAQGYATAHFGKWHLWGGGPENHGYDFSDGETNNDPGNDNPDPDNDPKLMFSITQSSIDFMNTQTAANKPFFVQLSHYATHGGNQFRPATKAYYDGLTEIDELFPNDNGARNRARERSAMTEDLDTTIGTLLAEIDDLGIADNTYVVLTSDNGIGWENGENYLRGEKWWLWDDAIRVPMIVRGPDIPAGTRTDTNVIQYDFLPTFVDWAGGDLASLPNDLDGVSLKNLMESPGVTPEFEDRSLYFHYPHTRESTPHSAVVKGTEKLMVFYENLDELHYYDTAVDPYESYNLENAKGRAQDLKEEFDEYLAAVRDDPYTLPVPNPDSDPANVPIDPDTDIPARVQFDDLPSLWGDINNDGTIDGGDVDAFVAAWRTDTSGLADYVQRHNSGDLNYDGAVDLEDWYLLRGALTGQNSSSFSAPEPTAFSLVALAAMMLAAARRR